MNTKEKKSIRKILAILFVVVIFATIPVSTAFANGDTRASTTTTKQTTVSGCKDDKHSMPTGNMGKWFNSRSEVDAYFSSTCSQWLTKYQNGEISRDDYMKKCPSGYKAWSCSKCGMWTGDFTYGEVPTEPSTSHTHSWDNGVVAKPATCTEKGVKTYTCNGCGETRTEAIAETGHNYKKTITKPTCTNDGFTTFTCTKCNSSYITDYIDALGHDLSYVALGNGTHNKVCNRCDLNINENCINEKHDDKYICIYCSAIYEIPTEPTQPTDPDKPTTEHKHSWDKGVITREATCTENGIMTYTCSTCGETKREVISQTGHSFKYEAIGDGTHKKICSKCDYQLMENCDKVKDGNKYVCSKCLVTYEIPTEPTVSDTTKPTDVTKPSETEPTVPDTTKPDKQPTTEKQTTSKTSTTNDKEINANENKPMTSPQTGASNILFPSIFAIIGAMFVAFFASRKKESEPNNSNISK